MTIWQLFADSAHYVFDFKQYFYTGDILVFS